MNKLRVKREKEIKVFTITLSPFYLFVFKSKIPRSPVFLEMQSHPGYCSSRSQTEPSFQNLIRNPHGVLCHIFLYPDTTTFLQQEYSFLSFAVPVSPVFLPFVSPQQFLQCPAPEYPWLQQFCHHHSASYKML